MLRITCRRTQLLQRRTVGERRDLPVAVVRGVVCNVDVQTLGEAVWIKELVVKNLSFPTPIAKPPPSADFIGGVEVTLADLD